MIAVFKEDCFAPIATLRYMVRKPGDHDTRQSSHTEDDSINRRGIGIMSPHSSGRLIGVIFGGCGTEVWTVPQKMVFQCARVSPTARALYVVNEEPGFADEVVVVFVERLRLLRPRGIRMLLHH